MGVIVCYSIHQLIGDVLMTIILEKFGEEEKLMEFLPAIQKTENKVDPVFKSATR